MVLSILADEINIVGVIHPKKVTGFLFHYIQFMQFFEKGYISYYTHKIIRT